MNATIRLLDDRRYIAAEKTVPLSIFVPDERHPGFATNAEEITFEVMPGRLCGFQFEIDGRLLDGELSEAYDFLAVGRYTFTRHGLTRIPLTQEAYEKLMAEAA